MNPPPFPPNLHDLETAPFLTRSWGPLHLGGCLLVKSWPPPNPSRLGDSPLLKVSTIPASAASQKANCFFRHRQDSLIVRTRQHSLPENPIQQGTDSQKTHIHCCLFATTPAAQPHTKPFASSGTAHMRTRLHSFPESPVQGRDRLTKNPHALLFVSHNSRQRRLTESSAPARTSLQKAHMRTRQHTGCFRFCLGRCR